MIRRWLIALLLVLGGHLVTGALGWTLLNVPESSIWMLLLSAVLTLLILMALGWTEVAALLTLTPGRTVRSAGARALRAWPLILPGLLILGGTWWLASWLDGWSGRHAGEIDAWLMLHFGWTGTSWLHRTTASLLYFLRWVVGPSMALALLSAGARGGPSALGRSNWIRAGLSGRRLGTMGLAWLLLVVLPLKAVYWRPDALPPGGLEPLFVGFKLGLLLLATQVGWTLALREAASDSGGV